MKRSQRDARKSKDLKRLIRKTGYSIAANNWRGALALAIVFGLLCSLAYAGIEYYGNYTASEASISVVYPEIADGTFPDGSRFTLYSLAGEDNIAAVLAQMQAEGKYTAFTTEELVRSVHARAIMDKKLKETVTSMQSAGNAYSYFASEYVIDFAQPREKGRTLVEQLQEEAMKLARKIAAGPLNCYAASKAMMNKSFQSDFDALLQEETATQAAVRMHPNAEEGLTAFLEKRKPTFRGC